MRSKGEPSCIHSTSSFTQVSPAQSLRQCGSCQVVPKHRNRLWIVKVFWVALIGFPSLWKDYLPTVTVFFTGSKRLSLSIFILIMDIFIFICIVRFMWTYVHANVYLHHPHHTNQNPGSIRLAKLMIPSDCISKPPKFHCRIFRQEHQPFKGIQFLYFREIMPPSLFKTTIESCDFCYRKVTISYDFTQLDQQILERQIQKRSKLVELTKTATHPSWPFLKKKIQMTRMSWI